MRPARRFSSFLKLTFLAASLAAIALAARTSAAQSQVSLGLPSAKGRPTLSASPADWDTAVHELVDRVAALSAPPGPIDLLVNNLSSLSPDEVAAIDERLRVELAKRHFRLASGQLVDATLNVTLAEGTDGYLIVAQVPRGTGQQAEQVAMVSVSKAAKKAEGGGGVSLEQTRIWVQPGVILDFALPAPAAGETPKMIVLEPGRLVFYSRLQDQWQIDHAVIIPPARPWLRAARGHIDISQGLATGVAGIPGIECKGDFTHPQAIQCGFVSQDTQPWIQGDPSVPKNLDIGGDAANVALQCDARPVVFATGKDDWTRPDFIQPYEMDTAGHTGAAIAGAPAEFAGPVTSLWATETSGAARAVVHNLKTGDYEAYVVTASCSH
jgi:NAD(P)-dependent dehydrogenase (short-subunit alcohol dehydrogenase family)